MINATKKWIFLKISGAILIPLMVWFILNLIKVYDQEYVNVSRERIRELKIKLDLS